MLRLLKKFPTHLLPILVCIKDRGKHESRFAVRAKYMTLDPEANKYVQYLQNIRIIQDFLMVNAEKNNISVLDNSNVDRSIAILHRVLLNMISFMASSSSCGPLSTLDYKMQVYKQVKSAQEKSLQSKEVLDIIHAKLSRKHAVSDFGEIRYTKELMYHPPKRSKKEDLDLLQELSDAPSLEN